MNNSLQNTFRDLLKIAGKILFVAGFVLGIFSLFTGFWPGLIYFIIMLAGAGLIAVSEGVDATYNFETGRIKNTIASLAESIERADYRWVNTFIKATAIGIAAAFILGLTILFFRQTLFKKSDTLHDCREITAALIYYKDYKKVYPANLNTLIANNPLRNGWYQDGWNKPYRYSTDNNGSSYTLISAGRDRKFYTNDDIVFQSN